MFLLCLLNRLAVCRSKWQCSSKTREWCMWLELDCTDFVTATHAGLPWCKYQVPVAHVFQEAFNFWCLSVIFPVHHGDFRWQVLPEANASLHGFAMRCSPVTLRNYQCRHLIWIQVTHRMRWKMSTTQKKHVTSNVEHYINLLLSSINQNDSPKGTGGM